MPSASQSPSERQPAPFDPRALHRSVIAVPLREAIETEHAETERLKQAHAEIVQGIDTGVFYRAGLTSDPDALASRVQAMLEEAIQELGDREGQFIRKPLPLRPGGPFVSLAHLDGRVIQELLGIDDASRAPILDRIWPTRFNVIIDINLNFKPPDRETTRPADGVDVPQSEDGLDVRRIAQEWIREYIRRAKDAAHTADPDQGVDEPKTKLSTQYVFARLEGVVIKALVAIDQAVAAHWALAEAEVAERRTTETLGAAEAAKRLGTRAAQIARLTDRFRTIHHIWPDFQLRNCVTRSIATVKADAAQRSFTALGERITWAVVDSGIDADHAHFRMHKNIDPASPYHADFTGSGSPQSALRDAHGHGTHVAGIIAGEQSATKGSLPADMIAVRREINERLASEGQASAAELKRTQLETVSGMAPKCELVSLKVLDRFGQGTASNVIAAISHIQQINHHGRELHIHGVNLSLGYPFDAKWFACGHSPLCVEVNRLVKSGVVVVIAAGNSGYGTLQSKEGQAEGALDLTINDPGNAEHAITVGSTHRDEPHRYGVSYFSSKGPTGDGRCKPDILAPGEKIISCAAQKSRLVAEETENADEPCGYFETSGTSMAAPHVSGAIAAFLSIRREFIGEPEQVKKIFTSTATDLGRDRYFQGSGLVDLMRAIQSV
jgi:serine protease AprX